MSPGGLSEDGFEQQGGRGLQRSPPVPPTSSGGYAGGALSPVTSASSAAKPPLPASNSGEDGARRSGRSPVAEDPAERMQQLERQARQLVGDMASPPPPPSATSPGGRSPGGRSPGGRSPGGARRTSSGSRQQQQRPGHAGQAEEELVVGEAGSLGLQFDETDEDMTDGLRVALVTNTGLVNTMLTQRRRSGGTSIIGVGAQLISIQGVSLLQLSTAEALGVVKALVHARPLRLVFHAASPADHQAAAGGRYAYRERSPSGNGLPPPSPMVTNTVSDDGEW